MTARASSLDALPSHADMVDAIVATYRSATARQCDAGRAWYPAAGAIARAIALDCDLDPTVVAHVMAALSPRNPWRWNVADAYAFARAAADGATRRPTATTFNANAERAWAFLTGAGDWTTTAPKVRAFVAAILGDVDSVVVDTWAIRVATLGRLNAVTDAQYPLVAAAYRDAARVLGADARDVQAVTWVAASDAGLASARRGRHDQTFKRGTAAFVVGLFAAA